MSARIIARFGLAALVSAGGLAAAGPARAGTPTSTGCPDAYELLSVAALEAQGPYRVPRQVDEAGNQDGYVCGKKVEDHAAASACGGPCALQLYNFTDNNRTPGH